MQEEAAVAAERTTLTTGDGRGRTRGVEVAYYTAGDPADPPVVLLHGCGLDAATVSYRYLVPELAADHRVYAPDLPGHGHSEKPRARYTTDYFEGVLEAFLADQGIERPSLVGLSMGGGVALGHALSSEVERLVLVDSYGLGEDAAWRPAASVGLRLPAAGRAVWSRLRASETAVREHLASITGASLPPDLVSDVYGAIQDPKVGRTCRSWQRSEFRGDGLATDHSDRLSGLETRTLLVHGRRDPLLPATWSATAAERLPAGETRLYEGVGHWPPRERPERFNEDVVGFLS
jgi:pimeloyl-ACP methyl ester carboxylesterase